MRIAYPEKPEPRRYTVELNFRLSDQTSTDDARAFLESFMIQISDDQAELAFFPLARLPISYRMTEPAGRYFLRASSPLTANLIQRPLGPENPHARDPFYTETFLHFTGDCIDGAHGRGTPALIDFKGGYRD